MEERALAGADRVHPRVWIDATHTTVHVVRIDATVHVVRIDARHLEPMPPHSAHVPVRTRDSEEECQNAVGGRARWT
jgi:hypothetical protein